MSVRLRGLLRLAPLALLVPAALAARQGDTVGRRPGRLFRATNPVIMWLTADWKTVFKERDSTSTKRFPGSMRFLDEKGDTVSLDVQLGTRGHYRLRVCSVTPLKVYFDKEKTKGTIFSGSASLKLTTHCQKGDRYAQNVLVEYAIYGMYNVLSPISLRARLATINWSDPKNPEFNVTRPGFWTEEDNDMAKRNKGKVLMQQGGHAEEMDPTQMAVTDIFQYMIANTDYSLSMLHNYRIVQLDSSSNFFPMAYDFDWSGLVDAPYSFPDSRLGIKRTTDRLYRGGCPTPEVLAATLALFRTKKEGLYFNLTGLPGLDPKRQKEAADFLDEFYKMIDDPGRVRREFRGRCN